jgi:hypothetical protein
MLVRQLVIYIYILYEIAVLFSVSFDIFNNSIHEGNCLRLFQAANVGAGGRARACEVASHCLINHHITGHLVFVIASAE